MYRPIAATRVGSMAIALFSHRPHKLQLLQAINGIQMWCSGASNKVSCLVSVWKWFCNDCMGSCAICCSKFKEFGVCWIDWSSLWLCTGDCCVLQLFPCFNHLGICQGVTATRRNVDVIATESRATLQQLQEDVVQMVKQSEVCTWTPL